MTRPGREQDRKSILRVVIVERVDHDLHDPDLHLEAQDVAGGVQEELLQAAVVRPLLPAAAGTSLRSASIFLLTATTRFVLDGLLNRLLAAPAAAAAQEAGHR